MQLFENFGDIHFAKPSSLNKTFIKNNLTDEDIYDTFSTYCKTVLNSNTVFNILEFHTLVFHLTNNNINRTVSIIINIFDEFSKTLKSEIESNISLQSFVKTYNKYLTNVTNLIKHLSYLDSKITLNSKNTYLNTIKTYMFYKNVINVTYTDQNIYMYEVLRKSIENSDMTDQNTVTTIKQLFKMYSFYNKFSQTPVKNKDTLFNDKIDKLFLSSLGSNQEFVKTIAYYLHNSIKELKNTNNTDNKTSVTNLSNLINLISENFTEREMFNMYYEKLLEMRLISNEYIAEAEFDLINNFSRPKDNKIIQNMIHKIEDIQKSLADETILHTKINLTVTPESSKKYPGVNLEKLNLKSLLPKVFRNYAWSYSRSDENDCLTVPFDVSPHIDVYNQYYKMKYPNRNLEWNFNHGTAVTKVKLGGKYYHLQLNTPQLFLLLQFNSQEKITALDLASRIGLPMSKLGKILTSFLRIKILCRESGKASNDPTMLIFLNKDFSHSSDKISLINIMATSQQQQKPNEQGVATELKVATDQAITTELKVENKFALVKESIIRQLKQLKTSTKQELFDIVKNDVSFNIAEKQFQTCLLSCNSEKLLSIDSDKLTYVELSE